MSRASDRAARALRKAIGLSGDLDGKDVEHALNVACHLERSLRARLLRANAEEALRIEKIGRVPTTNGA